MDRQEVAEQLWTSQGWKGPQGTVAPQLVRTKDDSVLGASREPGIPRPHLGLWPHQNGPDEGHQSPWVSLRSPVYPQTTEQDSSMI